MQEEWHEAGGGKSKGGCLGLLTYVSIPDFEDCRIFSYLLL